MDDHDGDSQKVMVKGLNFDEIVVFFFKNNNVLHCNVCRFSNSLIVMSTTMMVTNMMIMNGEDIDDVDIISAGVGIGAGYDKVLDQNHFQPLATS